MKVYRGAVKRAGLRFAAALSIAVVLARCAPGAPALPAYHGDPNVPGSVARVERVDGYAELTERLLLWYADLPVSVSHGIDLYRVSYWSRTNGKPVLASGLMSAPRDGALRGTVVWMHGTNVDRTRSVSAPSLQEGVSASAVFAGGGYLLLAPDLLGLGVSKARQAYLYNPSTVAVSEDFLRAAQRVTSDLGRKWNPDLYLVGFSQGGHSVAVLQRALEQSANPLWHLRAGAAISGAYDLSGISVRFAMKGRSTEDSVYLTNAALSYATYYGEPLDAVMNAKYARLARELFDGDHGEAIDKDMPADPRVLFTRAFLAQFDDGGSNWFLDDMRKNSVSGWDPKSPFRAYIGEKDVDVPPADSIAFVKEAKAHGGNATLVDVGPYDHNGTVYHAAPMIRVWFDRLSASQPAGERTGRLP